MLLVHEVQVSSSQLLDHKTIRIGTENDMLRKHQQIVFVDQTILSIKIGPSFSLDGPKITCTTLDMELSGLEILQFNKKIVAMKVLAMEEV